MPGTPNSEDGRCGVLAHLIATHGRSALRSTRELPPAMVTACPEMLFHIGRWPFGLQTCPTELASLSTILLSRFDERSVCCGPFKLSSRVSVFGVWSKGR